MNITDIFAKKGEEKFRELERYHLRKFESKRNFVLACGGGTPCFFDNMEWMKEHGIVIYLKAEPEVILKQIINETEQRPIIKNSESIRVVIFHTKKIGRKRTLLFKSEHCCECG